MGNICYSCTRHSTPSAEFGIQLLKPTQRTVLLLGEGNFSYALARVRYHLSKQNQGHLNLIATSFDSHKELCEKYPESVQILSKLNHLNEKKDADCRVSVLHRVDATRIKETLTEEALSQLTGVDEITFCHPHIGSEWLRLNSSLVAHFFHSAKQLNPSVIQVTLLKDQYERWMIPKVEKLNGLRQLGMFNIESTLYQPEYGYKTRRHQSGKSFTTNKVGKQGFSI